MKKFFVLSLLGLLLSGSVVHAQYLIKNRYVPIVVDTTIDGVWSGNNGIDIADSVYLNISGLPDYGDLRVPDLELKMKALWYGSKMYFLFRHLDDSLVNDFEDETIAEHKGMENYDATTLYLFLNDSTSRYSLDSAMYQNSDYTNYISWVRFVWGKDSIIGSIGNDTVHSIEDFGGEIMQWTDGYYNYAKLSIDIDYLDDSYVSEKTIINYELQDILKANPDSCDNYQVGDDTIKGRSLDVANTFSFEVQVNDNDKEVEKNGKYAVQTRAYLFYDNDSLALKDINTVRWASNGKLDISYGSFFFECEGVSFLKSTTSNFVTIYPNPASDYLFLEFDNYIAAHYKIVDVMGRVVKNGSANGYDSIIQVDDLSNGTYFVYIVNAKGDIMTQKLLINR